MSYGTNDLVELTSSNIIISGGNIDNSIIGATSPAAGTFTNLTASGTTTLAETVIDANGNIELGVGQVSNSSSLIDFHSETSAGTYTNYSLRILRAAGVNGNTGIFHRGTGSFSISLNEAADFILKTTNTTRLTIASGGDVTVAKTLIAADLTVPGILRKNVIINGGMDIWQRGTSFSGIGVTTNKYTADRLEISKNIVANLSIARSVVVPGTTQTQQRHNYSALLNVQATHASVAAGDFAFLQFNVEGYDYKYLYVRPQTISFWIRTNKTGVYGVSLRNGGFDRSYISEITVNASDTWEKKTITITAAPSGGSWNFTNGRGISLGICLLSGTTFQTTAGAWQSGNFITTSNQVNFFDNTANDMRIVGIQLERGTTATEFEHRPIGEELALCQRYYEIGVNGSFYVWSGDTINGTGYKNGVYFKTEKRSSPTVALTNATAFRFPTTFTFLTVGVDGFTEQRTANVTGNGGEYASSWTASSEL